MGIVTSTVSSTFANAATYAANATTQVNSFVNNLNTTIFTPPTVDVTWESLPAPTLPGLPSTPSLPSITFTEPEGKPEALELTEIDVEFDTFTEPAPVLSFPSDPGITTYTAPTIPAVAEVTLPDAPTLEEITAPTLLSLNTIGFGGVNMHDDWLTDLKDVPQLTLVEPTPYSFAPSPEYASALLDAIKAKLNDRLQGGTGLDPAVEQAIWGRARDRETKLALANEQEVTRASEALGYQLPAGVVAAQLRDAQSAYYDKLSELSRDVAIKQAELEQANLKDAVDQGIALESKLIDYSYQVERLAFENAKQYADNAIQVHNAAIEQYKGLLAGYTTYSANYKTIIDGELAKVEVYKGQLQAEQTKAQVNGALVAQYQAQIEAGLSAVKVYEAQVGAAQTLIQLEQTKISAAGEQIRAYVAKMNGETAKVEAYKAGIAAESAKMDAYKVKVEAFQTKVSTQATLLQAQLQQQAHAVQVHNMNWEGWKAAVQAEAIRMDALGKQSGAMLDGYRAGVASRVAEAEMTTKVWEGNIQQYKAGVDTVLQTAKINNDATIMTNNARLDASKVGAQVFAQLAASAYGMMNAGVSLSGQNQWGAHYQLHGEAEGTPVFDP